MTSMETLGTQVRFQSGGTPSRDVPEYYQGNVPWITSADISDTGVITPRFFITDEAIRRSATNLVSHGTILLVTRTSVGKVAIADRALCFSQDITALEPNQQLHPRYLAHFLRSRQGLLASSARGATIKGITREAVSALRVPLPSIDMQLRIADVLDHVETLRIKRREALSLLDGLVESIFLEKFGNPVTNVRGWPERALSELGSLERGVSKHRPRNDPKLLGGPYPLIQTGDVANSNGYIDRFSATYSDLGLAQSRLWPAGTLCITVAANIAKTGILRVDACFPDSVVGFSSDPDTTEFVQVWLSFLQEALERQAPESAQKNINLAVLRGLMVPDPEPALIADFAENLRAVNVQKARQVAQLANLDALFASVQYRAFRGELFEPVLS